MDAWLLKCSMYVRLIHDVRHRHRLGLSPSTCSTSSMSPPRPLSVNLFDLVTVTASASLRQPVRPRQCHRLGLSPSTCSTSSPLPPWPLSVNLFDHVNVTASASLRQPVRPQLCLRNVFRKHVHLSVELLLSTGIGSVKCSIGRGQTHYCVLMMFYVRSFTRLYRATPHP